MYCKKGGLIMARHNELRDGVAEFLGKDFTPAHVRDDPKIFTGRGIWGGEGQKKSKSKGMESRSPEEGGWMGAY